MTCSESSEIVSSIQPESQPAPPVFVKQLSQKQTLLIWSMYKLCLSKIFSWLRHWSQNIHSDLDTLSWSSVHNTCRFHSISLV